MGTSKQGSWKNWTIGALLAGGLVFAGGAQADERHSRHGHDRQVRKGQPARHEINRDRSQVRRARRENRRLDQHGRLIDLQLDGLALLASANGDYELAHVLDRTGDHIERRLDRKGNRKLRQARRNLRSHRHSQHCAHGDRIDRRHSRRHPAKHHMQYDRSKRKRDHSDWLSDRARKSKRDGKNRRDERWDD